MNNITDIESKIKENNIQMIRFLYCDNSGVIKCKTGFQNNFSKLVKSGVTICVIQQIMTPFGPFADVKGFEPNEDILLSPDLSSFRILPYMNNCAGVMNNIITYSGKQWDACPRFFLQRMIKKLEDEFSIKLKVSFENEFTLYKEDENKKLITLDSTSFASTTSILPYQSFILESINSLEQQNIMPALYYAEGSPGQQEISFKYSDPLNAADNHVFYKETIRNIAYKNDFKVSFAAKPDLKQEGNGSHIHISAWDKENKQNLFYDPNVKYNLSKTAQHFMAGILKHVPALLAVTAPTVNSYRRLVPDNWASAYSCWGIGNREATLRVIRGLKENESSSLHFEYKPSDPTVNPYIGLGCLIAAAIDGLKRELTLSPSTQKNPCKMSDSERKALNIERYPLDLKSAIGNLERDDILLEALGDDLARSYVGVKKREIETFAEEDSDFEIKNHIFMY